MYHAYNHKVGIQFVNHKYDCMITDRIGQHEVLLPINQNYDKFEKETRHQLYVSIKKKQLTQQNVRQLCTKMMPSFLLHRHDMLTVNCVRDCFEHITELIVS